MPPPLPGRGYSCANLRAIRVALAACPPVFWDEDSTGGQAASATRSSSSSNLQYPIEFPVLRDEDVAGRGWGLRLNVGN